MTARRQRAWRVTYDGTWKHSTAIVRATTAAAARRAFLAARPLARMFIVIRSVRPA